MQDMNETCEKITHTEMIDRGFTGMYTVKPHHACMCKRANARGHARTQTRVQTLISDLCKIWLGTWHSET